MRDEVAPAGDTPGGGLEDGKPGSTPGKVPRQVILYFSFAVLAAGVNLFIQFLNKEYVADWVCGRFQWEILARFYCPESWRVLVGSAVGVVVGYLLKFTLDKFVVFEKKGTNFKQTSREFSKYFLFAIFTTVVINLGGQMLLFVAFGVNYLVAGSISLACGYTVKFLLDRAYVFVDE
ncbi:MAG: GtrA family protein [Promethearchaeota archaeon]